MIILGSVRDVLHIVYVLLLGQPESSRSMDVGDPVKWALKSALSESRASGEL